jgi:hypothetical protein
MILRGWNAELIFALIFQRADLVSCFVVATADSNDEGGKAGSLLWLSFPNRILLYGFGELFAELFAAAQFGFNLR